MFSLVHFSRVFPYIHPYRFALQTAQTAEPAAATATSPACHARCASAPVQADVAAMASAPAAAASVHPGQAKRLKNLYRRHLRSHRNDALTYSGALRHLAW